MLIFKIYFISTFRHNLNIQSSILYSRLRIMKTISIFILLIYWSVILFAPVVSKDFKLSRAKYSKNETYLSKVTE